MRLELSRRAQADLDDIRDYSVAEFGVERAVAYLDAVESAFRRILEVPEIGAAHPVLRPPARSLGCQQHRIYYEVMHKAMEVERHL